MSETESTTKNANGAKTLLSRVRWNPSRYSDNVGVQFLIELGEIGKSNGVGEEAAINSFLTRMSVSSDLYRETFSEQEELALKAVAQRCSLHQQLQDSALVGNVKKSIMSRRGFIGGLGGAAVGAVFSNITNSFNPDHDPKVVATTKATKKMAEERDKLFKRESDLADALGKRNEDLSDEEREAIIQLSRDKLGHNRTATSVTEAANKAISPYQDVVKNFDKALPVVGAGLGIYAATAGEGQRQAGLKFEAFVKQMDDIINYRLGRSPIARDTSGR